MLIGRQEEDTLTLHLGCLLLLYDGRRTEVAYNVLAHEGAFPRLIILIRDGADDSAGLHRLLLELLFEMCRIQAISCSDLGEPCGR